MANVKKNIYIVYQYFKLFNCTPKLNRVSYIAMLETI